MKNDVIFAMYLTSFMEKITIEKVEALLNSNTLEFRAGQTKLFFPLLKRMFIKMQYGVVFPDIKVDDGYIVEGHHRYICSQLCKTNVGVIKWKKSWSAIDCQWEKITIETVLWEDPKIVQKHDEDDAKNYGIDIDFFKK